MSNSIRTQSEDWIDRNSVRLGSFDLLCKRMRYSKKKTNLPVSKTTVTNPETSVPGEKGTNLTPIHTTEQSSHICSLAALASHFMVSMVTAIPLFSKTQHSPVAFSFLGSSQRCFSMTAHWACPTPDTAVQ